MPRTKNKKKVVAGIVMRKKSFRNLIDLAENIGGKEHLLDKFKGSKKGSKNKDLTVPGALHSKNIRGVLKQMRGLESAQSPKTAVYSLELKVNDKTYQSEGNTLEEALNNIKIEPTRGVVKLFTKGVLKVKKGDKEFERLLMIRQMAGVFGEASKLGREVATAKLSKLVSMLLPD